MHIHIYTHVNIMMIIIRQSNINSSAGGALHCHKT